MSNGDSYNRIEVSPGVYQCGCRWVQDSNYGDVLVECTIHRQATISNVSKSFKESITKLTNTLNDVAAAARDFSRKLDTEE